MFRKQVVEKGSMSRPYMQISTGGRGNARPDNLNLCVHILNCTMQNSYTQRREA